LDTDVSRSIQQAEQTGKLSLVVSFACTDDTDVQSIVHSFTEWLAKVEAATRPVFQPLLPEGVEYMVAADLIGYDPGDIEA
jgi:hypothetical protein